MMLLAKNTNYSPCEYLPYKLLINSGKCQSIMNVARRSKEYDDTLPISIEIHPTNRCNSSCSWCVDRKMRQGGEILPYSSLIRFLDNIKGTGIGLTIEGGGEPTQYPDFDKFIAEASERDIHFGIITNGIVPIAHPLISKFKWIRISLDASTREEYRTEKGGDNFDAVMATIKQTAKFRRNAIVGVSFVLTNRNHTNVIHLLHTVQEYDVDYFQMRCVEECPELNPTQEMMDALTEKIRREFKHTTLNVMLNPSIETNQCNNQNLPCIAHSLRSVIHADGNVVLCEKRRHDPIILGNINQSNFTDLWKSTKKAEVSRKLLDPKSQMGCSVCRITKFNAMFHELANIRTNSFI